MDPRTPVLVGGGQLNRRSDPLEPVDLVVEAVRLAAQDAGAPALAQAVESVRLPAMMSWHYRDPGSLVGERLGAHVRHSVYTGTGGCHPQALVHEAASDIAAGRCDVVVVGGAEAWRTVSDHRKRGELPPWTVQDDDVPPADSRPDVAMHHPSELAAGLDRPSYIYAVFETALRASAGRSVGEHQRLLGRLWSRFSDVAVTNPHAWVRTPHSADDITTVGPDNRMVSSPYPKLMNSNASVEQGAAVILCSAEAAERHGVPRDRWVFPRSGADAADTGAIAARPRLDGSSGIRHASRAALELAGLELGDLGPIDLYSCFPSAVQVAAQEIGVPIDDPARPLTVTGGLTFAGGPWNNYSTHAIAAMLAEVRRTGQPGLLTANSGYLTKHAIGVYAPDPGDGWRHADVQEAVDADGSVEVAEGYEGPGVLEAWTVRHDRDGVPDLAMAALRTPDGARTLAQSADPELAAALATGALEGTPAAVRAEATFSLVD